MIFQEITVKYGKTFNLGNYESERLDLSITVLVNTPLKEKLDEAFEYALSYVTRKVHGISDEEEKDKGDSS